MGKMFFSILAAFAGCEADLTRMRTYKCMAVAEVEGNLRAVQPKLSARRVHGHRHYAV